MLARMFLASGRTLLLLALCLGCGGRAESPPSALWIVLDAARARAFSAYGNELPTTPRIDAFAADATVFERAYAQAVWTQPSAASYLTGRYPATIEAVTRVEPGQLLAATLREAGWRTAAFSENPYVTERFGFADGFELFREYFPYQRIRDTPHTFGRTDSTRTVDDAIEWIDRHAGEPFFAYVHLLPPHAPYGAPAPFGGRFDPDYAGSVDGTPDTLIRINRGEQRIAPRDLEHLRLQYLENLAFADHETGRLLEALRQRGLLDRTLVVISSDHGEAFREHGLLTHNYTVYEELVRVPLIVRFPPDGEPAPGRWEGVVELRDVHPTICDVLSVPACARRERSLRARLRAGAGGDDSTALTFSRQPSGELLTSLVWRNFKLVMDGERRRVKALFDLRLDPEERENVARANPGLTARLGERARAIAAERLTSRTPEVGADTRERLRALGYAE